MDHAVEMMRDAKTIAVVGIAPDPLKPSNYVARYLIDQGYEVYLVNPTEAGTEIHGRTVYPSVSALPESVDIVDVFRRPEFVPPVVQDAIAARAKAVWLQLGIVNDEAGEAVRAAGLDFVQDRCTKIEHARIPR